MPVNMKLYGPAWKQTRERILERAGHKCERCGVPNYTVGYRLSTGEFREPNYPQAYYRFSNHADLKREGLFRIVLTIAHLIPDGPLDCPDSELQALCQKCHNAIDAPMRARHRKEKAEAAKDCGSLFSGQEGAL
jgi:5-methylcytosine-specific restriction endonuclease McrA